MPIQQNNGRGAQRPGYQDMSRQEEWRPAYEARNEQRWVRHDQDWNRDVSDRDVEYRRGREIESGRFIQGERRFNERPQLGYEPYERGGYGSPPGYGYGMRPYGSQMRGEGISHRGKGPRNFMLTDERICERVCEVLTDDDRIDASDIDVNVRDGEVMLTGTVDDRRTKRLVEDVIEDLPGVKDVHVQLRVRQGMFGKSSVESAIDRLNSFLRGELAAVETYRMALDKLDKGSPARSELENCKRSHAERVNLLQDEISRLGGTPSTSSGPWGVFARTIEGGARVLGDRVAIAALEEGEDHGVKDYKSDIDKLEPEFRSLVRSRLLPAQEDTHSRMSTLKHRLS